MEIKIFLKKDSNQLVSKNRQTVNLNLGLINELVKKSWQMKDRRNHLIFVLVLDSNIK